MILVLQHHDAGGPGRLGRTLRDHAHTLDIRRLHDGDTVPTDLHGVTGVISLGGPQNVGDPSAPAWMAAEIELLAQAHQRNVPTLGICLGCQMLAAALGGEVGPMPPETAPEIGAINVSLLPIGQTETMMAGIAWDAPWLLSHGYEVKKAPAGAMVLAKSDACGVQVFKAGLCSYGVQFHFEADRAQYEAILREDSDFLRKAGLEAHQVLAEADAVYETVDRFSDRLCGNIASFLFPARTRVDI